MQILQNKLGQIKQQQQEAFFQQEGMPAGLSSFSDSVKSAYIKTKALDKNEQQDRLLKDSVLKRYTSRIKEIDSLYKTLTTSQKDEKVKLSKQRAALVKERDRMLKFDALKDTFDRNNPEHVKKFEMYNTQFNGDRAKVNKALSEEFKL